MAISIPPKLIFIEPTSGKPSCPAGLLLAGLAGLLLGVALPAAHAAAYTVTTTADSSPGLLRRALLDANASPGADMNLGCAAGGLGSGAWSESGPGTARNLTVGFSLR